MDVSSGDISAMVFGRVLRDDLGEFSLDGNMLRLLMELDGKKNLAVIAKNMGLNMGTVRAVVLKLLQLKLIEPLEDSVSVVDTDFLEFLNNQLSLSIGPIAEIIIEDIVNELGYSLSKFPSHRAAELVDLLSKEIQREEKRRDFTKNMVDKIREKEY
ncbi:hypothetical protein DRN98_03775 [Methanosarcinales archaeon]|nr:MAG: hypothetical protein DRN98_03775 [Methanosarcinales archaeon]